jgi:hypothetical protein
MIAAAPTRRKEVRPMITSDRSTHTIVLGAFLAALVGGGCGGEPGVEPAVAPAAEALESGAAAASDGEATSDEGGAVCVTDDGAPFESDSC